MKTKTECKNQPCQQLKLNNLLTSPAGVLLLCLAAAVPAFGVTAGAETLPAGIPFSEIGARTTADYHGDALSITATTDGARLRCGFQRLEARATTEGLWLASTAPGAAGKVRVTASAIGRAGFSTLNAPPSTLLPATGTVSVTDKLVRFTRAGVTEEYSVGVDGVRQDFIIAAPPAGAGDLRVELALSGARAEATGNGVKLKLNESGRELAYGRLRAEDATGRELKARLEVLSPDRLAVSVDDANAPYPVRIDPTFSDNNWVSLNGNRALVSGHCVLAVTVDGSGNMYAGGGQFLAYYTTNSLATANIAKWDGINWWALDSGINDFAPRALAVSGTNLYAGGFFSTADGVPARNIAKWNGSSWSALGTGVDWEVLALAVSGANLYVGGIFTNAGGVPANCIAKWAGSSWGALVSGISAGGVLAVAVSGRNLYVGGWFTNAGGVPANCIAKWDGRAWSPLGSGTSGARGYVAALAVSGTNLYVGGSFAMAGGVAATNISKWDGSTWSALGLGVGRDTLEGVVALAVSGTDQYAGGNFQTAGGVPANYIAKWDGSTWSTLGSGVSNGGSAVRALAADELRHLFVGGDFCLAGRKSSPFIAEVNFGPAILALPQTQTVENGSVVNLVARVCGDPSPNCQWFFNGNALAGCTNSILCLSGVQATNAGTYSVLVWNNFGTVTSAPVMLNVIPPVPRRSVPGVNVMGQSGSLLNVDYANTLWPAPAWNTFGSVSLTSTSQFCFDLTTPLPAQRFYRAWQNNTTTVVPALNLNFVSAITLTGNIGDRLRLDGIAQIGPTDAWVNLATVTLTNTTQLYFDVSAIGQPQRLYRIVPAP